MQNTEPQSFVDTTLTTQQLYRMIRTYKQCSASLSVDNHQCVSLSFEPRCLKYGTFPDHTPFFTIENDLTPGYLLFSVKDGKFNCRIEQGNFSALVTIRSEQKEWSFLLTFPVS